MAETKHWSDLKEGEELKPLEKIATTQTCVKFAGATAEFSAIHFDSDFAHRQGLPDTIVPGQLKRAWLIHFVTSWAGKPESLKKISIRFKGMDIPRSMESDFKPVSGETWQCAGRIARKYQESGSCYVDLDIWIQDSKGRKTTEGEATVALPC